MFVNTTLSYRTKTPSLSNYISTVLCEVEGNNAVA